MQSVMRFATFIPTDGIRARLFAKLISLENMDTINDLTELGFIQNPEMDKIVLYPLVQEIILSDLCPDTENCRPLLDNTHRTCLQHGVDISYYCALFAITENITDKITVCDKSDYLLFIEECFSYMEKYRYASGMKKLTGVMSNLLSDDFGTQNDRALLLNNQASCEGLLNGNYKKAIDLEKRAINMCDPAENPMLAANLHMNLGYLYQADGKTDLAKPSMERAMQILAEINQPTHDMIIMTRNYSRLLAETGEARKALTALRKCADFVKANNSELTTDYADILFDIAGITSQIDGILSVEHYFIKALKIYREILPYDDLREKAALAVRYFERTGVTKLPNYLTLE